MLKSLSSIANASDLGVDRALMGLDIAHERMQANHNESLMLSHIRKLEQDLRTRNKEYNDMVRMANDRIGILKEEVIKSHADIEQLKKQNKSIESDSSIYLSLIRVLEDKLKIANSQNQNEAIA